MKQFALTFTFIVLLQTLSWGQVTFQRTYGGSADDVAYSADICTDGGYIMAGYTTSFGVGGTDVFVIKTDSLGEVKWAKTYGGADDDQANVIKQTDDGGYLIGGYSESFGNKAAYIIKIDSTGSMLWNKVLGKSGFDEINDMIIASTGEYVLVGRVNARFAMLKMDNSGNILLSKLYENVNFANAITECVNGDFLLAGHGDGTPSYYSVLLRVNSNGNVIWNRFQYGTGLVAVRELPNTDIIAVGGGQINFGNGKGVALKLSSTGTPIYYKSYRLVSNTFFFGVEITNTGDFVTGGHVIHTFPNWQATFSYHNQSDGTATLSHEYGGINDAEWFNNIVYLGNKGLVGVGQSQSFSGGISDFYLVKAGSNLETNCHDSTFVFNDTSSTDTGEINNIVVKDSLPIIDSGGTENIINANDTLLCIEVYGCMDTSATNYNPNATIDDGSCILSANKTISSNQINIYPNPSNQKFMLDFKNFQHQVNSITVYDQKGNEVYKQILQQGEKLPLELDLNKAKSGQYHLIITSDKSSYSKTLIVK